MKFLVLALCVCAASAASFGSNTLGAGSYTSFKGLQNTAAAANTAVAPTAFASKTVGTAAATAVFAPVVAAEAVYQTGKQVVNKGYTEEGQAAILRYDNEAGVDNYRVAYETANGIKSEVNGVWKQLGDSGSVVAQGSFAYTSPDGTPVQVSYTADENGYQPQSESLPVGPEIPPAIARALLYIASKSKDNVQKY